MKCVRCTRGICYCCTNHDETLTTGIPHICSKTRPRDFLSQHRLIAKPYKFSRNTQKTKTAIPETKKPSLISTVAWQQQPVWQAETNAALRAIFRLFWLCAVWHGLKLRQGVNKNTPVCVWMGDVWADISTHFERNAILHGVRLTFELRWLWFSLDEWEKSIANKSPGKITNHVQLFHDLSGTLGWDVIKRRTADAMFAARKAATRPTVEMK